MANIDNYGDLEVALTKALVDAMPEVGEKAVEVVKERIDKDVYGSYNPVKYKRTYDLRDSVEVENNLTVGKGSVEVTVGHNTGRIGSSAPNQHYSVVDGSSSSDYVAEIVHDGRSGKIFGRGAWTKKRRYMDNAGKELKRGKARQFLADELRSQGFDVK